MLFNAKNHDLYVLNIVMIQYCDESEVATYTCYRACDKIHLDGRLDARSWQLAPKSPRFVDMINGQPGFYDTRAAAVWDDENFYVGFWIDEPFPVAQLTQRDATIFQENDVEVFIDGGDCYYEFEINALNTVYEVFFIWRDAYQRGGKFDMPEFDVFKPSAHTFGGNHDRDAETFWRGTHPRGGRWAFVDWDLPGLQSAVYIDGELNNPAIVSAGWRVELALPWAGMKWLANGRSLPPKDGDEWRIFFGRFQKLRIGDNIVSPSWAWNRIGDGDNHMPECFTKVVFSEQRIDAIA